MQILGYHLDRDSRAIYTSNGEICKEPPYIEFLLKDKDTLRICYHIDFMVSNLLKILSVSNSNLIKLYETSELKLSGYKFKYVPKKFFSIEKEDKFIVMADASQYMERWDLVGDPLEKAKEACKLGGQVYNALSKLGLHPKTLVSPISAFDKEIFSKLDLPDFSDIPPEASEYAYNCCHGPWVSAFQTGHWDKVYDLDVVSAYPFELTKCIDTRLGTWIKTDKWEECYSEDTQVMTIDNGWTNIDKIKRNDSILCFDQNTNDCIFDKVILTHKYKYKGNLINIQSRTTDLLVTPRHKILYKHRNTYSNKKIWYTKQACKIHKSALTIPCSYQLRNDRPDYIVYDSIEKTNALLQVLAWINTEGSLYKSRKDRSETLFISQSHTINLPNCLVIEKCLEEAGIDYSIHKTASNTNIYYIKAKSLKWYIKGMLDTDIHLIPMWILQSCSISQLKLYFDTLIKGDGSDKGETCKQFYTKSRGQADRFSMLCQLLGYRHILSSHKNRVSAYVITVSLTKHHSFIRQSKQITNIPYEGYVYCPTVPSGFIVTRRNDRVSISGNSSHYGYARGIVNITSDFSPIIYSKTNEMSYNPKGEWETFLNKKEIEFIRKYNIGDFQLDEAWWFFPDKIVYPLKKVIEWLYTKKETSKGMERKIVKRIMSGIWGRCLQVDFGEVAGEYFNSVWGCETEVGTRLEVARFILDNDLVDHVIHIAVDGVLVDKEVTI